MTDQVVRLVLRVDESGKFVGEIKKGDRALHELGTAADRTGQQTKELGRESGELGKSLLSAERAAGVLKLALASLGIASVGALFSSSIDSARGFSAALAEISTLLADTSGIAGLRRELQEISIEFGKLPEAQAKAFYQIVSAGAETAAEQMALLRASNRLAVGGITEVEIAADGLTSTLNAFGDAVGNSEEVSDKFFATMKGGKTTIAEISSSIGSVAPLAAQLDVSLDEVLATVIAVTKGGETTSKAMKGMAQAMAAILKPSSEARDLAAELGIEFNAASLATKGWAGFLDHLVEKTGASAEKLSQLFGGTEALLPVLTLTGKGAENFARGLDDIGRASGATGEAVRRVTDEIGAADHSFNQFAASMTVIATELGDPLINVLAPAAKVVADNLFEIVEVGGDLLRILTGMLVAKAVAVAFGALRLSTAGAALGFQMMSTFGAAATAQMIAQTAAANAATTAMRGLTVASRFFGGPLGLAIGAATTALLFFTEQTEDTVIAQRDLHGELEDNIAQFREFASEAQKAALNAQQVRASFASDAVVRLETQIANSEDPEEIRRLSKELEQQSAKALEANLAIALLRDGVGELAETSTVAAEALALSADELKEYEKLLATLDPIGTAIADYRDAVALLDAALASGAIPSHAEYNKLIAALDVELANVLKQKPAAEIRAWAAEQRDLTDATIANNAADKVWVENHKDAVEKLAEFREGLKEEIELSGLTQEQREEELVTRELLNLAREAGIELTEDEARAEAKAVTMAQRAAKEREQALNQNLNLYKRFIDEVEGGFKDAFKEAFREGEGGFKRLIDGFENLFLDMLAELAFQAIAKPIIVPVLQQVGTGFFGLSGGQVNNVLSQQGLLQQGLGQQGLGSINGIAGPIGSGGGGGFNLSGLSNLFSGGGLSSLGFNAGAGNLGVDLAQFIGGGAETQAAFGNAFARGGSIGGFAGGFAGNLLADALLGDRGVGANIGGSIGAIAGSFIPIPVLGTALGAFVGNAIGGLFGNNKPSVGEVIAATFGDGGRVSSIGTDNGGSASAARDFGDQISAIIKRILDVTGQTIDRGFSIEQSARNGFMTSTAAGNLTSGDDLVAAIRFGLANSASGGDPVFNNLLATGNVGSIDELVSLLESAEQFKATLDGLTAANDNLTQGEQAIKALTDQLDGLREQAIAFGFSVAQIDAAEAISRERLADDFNAGISDALLTALDPVRAAAVAMIEQQEVRVRDTLALGGDLAQVEKLHLLQRRDFLRQLTEEQRAGLTDLIDLTDDFAASLASVEQTLSVAISDQLNASASLARAYLSQAADLRRAAASLSATRVELRFSDKSTLSPLEQLSEARSIVDGLKGKALAGDEEALAELPAAVKRFIDASAAYNADNAAFVADFEEMQALLAQAASIATDTADIATTQAELLAEQANLLKDILATLSAPSPDAGLLQNQLSALNTLNAQLDGPLAIEFDGFDLFTAAQARTENLLGQLVALAQTDLNAEINTQAGELAAERIAAIETATAKAIADAQAAAQNQINAALARAAAAEAAARAAEAGATGKYEDSLIAGLASEKVFTHGTKGGSHFTNFSDGINSLEASVAGQSSLIRQLAFLNPDRLLSLANDETARAELRRQLSSFGVPGYASGGYIAGPGTKTSDSIPIMSSRGEYVIQASAVDHFGVGFFDSLNAGVNPARNDAVLVAAIGRLENRIGGVTQAVVAMGGDMVSAVGAGTEITGQLARELNRNARLTQRQRGAAA